MECIGSDMSNNSKNDQKSDDPEDMRVVLQEAKTRAKAKNMQELAENVARKLSKQHPKKEKIEDHYRQSGYPEGGADTDGQEQENKGKDNATEGSEKTDMTDPDELENAFGPKRNEEERPVMSGKRQLDRAAASPTYTAPDGTKHKQKDYDPYKERLQKGWNERRDNALGLQPGSTWRGTGKPLTDAEKKEQENVGKLPSLKDDPKGRLQHEAT